MSRLWWMGILGAALAALGAAQPAARSAGPLRLLVVTGGHPYATSFYTIFEGYDDLRWDHAVSNHEAFRSDIRPGYDVLVLYGDAPLVTAATLGRARKALAMDADAVVVGFRTSEPTGYGRLIEEKGRLVAIVEEKDATAGQKHIGFCNTGIVAFRGEGLLALLRKIGNRNAKGEYYLTDAIALASAAKRKVVAIEADADEAAGVNDRIQLSHVEGIFQRHMREAAACAFANLGFDRSHRSRARPLLQIPATRQPPGLTHTVLEAQEVESVGASCEVHDPRFLGVQAQPERFQDRLDPGLGL